MSLLRYLGPAGIVADILLAGLTSLLAPFLVIAAAVLLAMLLGIPVFDIAIQLITDLLRGIVESIVRSIVPGI